MHTLSIAVYLYIDSGIQNSRNSNATPNTSRSWVRNPYPAIRQRVKLQGWLVTDRNLGHDLSESRNVHVPSYEKTASFFCHLNNRQISASSREKPLHRRVCVDWLWFEASRLGEENCERKSSDYQSSHDSAKETRIRLRGSAFLARRQTDCLIAGDIRIADQLSLGCDIYTVIMVAGGQRTCRRNLRFSQVRQKLLTLRPNWV